MTLKSAFLICNYLLAGLALSLSPKMEQAHYFLGEVYDEMGQGLKAILNIRPAEKLAGQNKNRALQNKALMKLNMLNEKYSVKK